MTDLKESDTNITPSSPIIFNEPTTEIKFNNDTGQILIDGNINNHQIISINKKEETKYPIEKINEIYRAPKTIDDWLQRHRYYHIPDVRREEILFPKKLSLVYDPTAVDFTAGYNPIDNTIVLSRPALESGAEALRSVLAHEKAHSIYDSLSEEQQLELVRKFSEIEQTHLEVVYKKLRSGTNAYPREYFGRERNKILHGFSSLLGRGIKTGEFRALEIDGEIEEVELGVLFSEVVAFAQTFPYEHTILDNDFMRDVYQLSRVIIEEMENLSSYGLLDVDASDLMSQMYQIPEYKGIQSKIFSGPPQLPV